MAAFQRLGIKGFRRLYDLDIELRPLTVMIGANGSGKTSVLDVISFLSTSASGNMNAEMSRMGGITNNLTYNKADKISLSVDMKVPGFEPLKYNFTLSPKDNSYLIDSETLTQLRTDHNNPFKHIDSKFNNIKYYEVKEKKLMTPTWDHNYLETSLSQTPKMFKEPEKLRQMLSSSTMYHALQVDSRAPIKLPQAMQPSTLPGKDGEDIIPLLYYLRETDKDRYEVIHDTLCSAFPDFEELNFPPVATGMLTMTWKDKRLTKPFAMSQLSEGTLRFLWLVTLLQSPGLTPITMIDEPEISLHPELLSLFAELLTEASEKTNVLIATHSESLVRFLEPSQVLVFDINEEGTTDARWGDEFDLDEWLKDYTLDSLWQKGLIGGRS